MATSLLTWLMVSLLGAVIALQSYLQYQLQLKWMRMFCEKLSIPPTSMDAAKVEKVAVPVMKVDNRPRISIPIPVGGIPRPIK